MNIIDTVTGNTAGLLAVITAAAVLACINICAGLLRRARHAERRRTAAINTAADWFDACAASLRQRSCLALGRASDSAGTSLTAAWWIGVRLGTLEAAEILLDRGMPWTGAACPGTSMEMKEWIAEHRESVRIDMQRLIGSTVSIADREIVLLLADMPDSGSKVSAELRETFRQAKARRAEKNADSTE